MCCGKKCIPGILICLLVVIGALNWGLVGIGMLMNKDLNVVNMLIGAWPMVEAIVYILVGIAGLAKIFHDSMCACKKGCCGDCKGCGCGCTCEKCMHGDCCKGGKPTDAPKM